MRRAWAALLTAALLAPVPWALPFVARGSVLEMGLLAGVAAAAIVVARTGDPRRRGLGQAIALAGGLVATSAVAHVVWSVRGGQAVPAAEWVWVGTASATTATLYVAAFGAVGLRAGPALALLLATVVPATASVLPFVRPSKPLLTLSRLVAAAHGPPRTSIEALLVTVAEGDRKALFDGGSDDYRRQDCLMDLEGCPPLPSLPAGDFGPLTVHCSALRNRCTVTAADGRWEIETDAEGRFGGAWAPSSTNAFTKPLPHLPDAAIWIDGLVPAMLSGALLAGGVWIGLTVGGRTERTG